MKVTELIYQLLDMCRENNVNPNDIEVNMREDWDSDIVVVAYDNEEGGSHV